MQSSRALKWRTGSLAALASATLLLSACGSGGTAASSGTSAASSAASSAAGSATSSGSASSGSSSAASSGSATSGSAAATEAAVPTIVVPEGETVGVSLITKTQNNPFFIALNEAAEAEAAKVGVNLTLASGSADGDEQAQIDAVEQAIARGDKGILITTNGPGVNPALEKAKAAGIIIIALDTPLTPTDLADMTFASNNFTAGTLIGEWAAAQLNGEKATIAMLDLFNDKIVSLDHQRDQGFLTGMGIDTKDDQVNGDEDPTGTYSGGKGGEYEIVCNEPTTGSNDGGRSAMELCLTQDSGPNINTVYSLNEPAGAGGVAALTSANITAPVVVSIDGGCGGIADVTAGVIGATALQYPSRMAAYGVDTVAALARGGEAPAFSPGLDFFDTGLTLVTDSPVDGLPSITSAEAQDICWG
ncbi:substrate-binding domain-containing protein [Nakamurella flavida]|uniref:Substrate-binding domain-containing protein n=1 Tax=Nakamurella flavida TaxID=363630 RepID=A0A938YD92_9ACTN|nr:substrate-binding domain-containing protein [Nakamurella flavida]MBM9475535.1 substrate-binding domain-containing protein [Nakamurella flavida]MDP9778190.1 fructose transport system substrate-binding protein [Nakamurella flavida]